MTRGKGIHVQFLYTMVLFIASGERETVSLPTTGPCKK